MIAGIDGTNSASLDDSIAFFFWKVGGLEGVFELG